ncbi:MAG: aminotransferase class IV [Caldilineales bacterium]|nr:aminotransferase class IV [Caldilineales bacterium]
MDIYPHLIKNGRFIAPSEAVLPLFTPALVGALGVYETILALHGRYIDLDAHLQRLFVSAAGAQLHLDVDIASLARWCAQLLAANAPEGLVRVLAVDLGQPAADLFLYQMHYTAPGPQAYEQGVAVILYAGERSLPQVKSFNTLTPGLARKAADAAGVHDALLVDREGHITEGTNCNLFAVAGGALLAPPVGAVLEGTVMARTMALAAQNGIPVTRRPLPAVEIPAWEEAFLTSTRRRILPLHRIGEHTLPAPGALTRRLMQAYWAWEEGEIGRA